MTEAQKKLVALQKRAAELNTQLNDIDAAMEDGSATDEQRAQFDKLRTERRDLDARLVKAAEDVEAENREAQEETTTDLDSEQRELRDLRGRVSFAGDYVSAALEQRSVDGAALEYNQALQIPGNRFPLDMLAPPVEERATTDVDSTARPSRWLDRLFAESAAMKVGTTFDSPQPGAATYPITTAGAAGAQRGRAEAAADAAWTVGVTELKPTRNTVRAVFFHRRRYAAARS